MYDLTVAHVDGNMSDAASIAVEEKISCLNIT